MYAEFYRGANYVEYAVFAFVLFFVVFLGVVGWVIAGKRSQWDRAAQLPLDGDEP